MKTNPKIPLLLSSIFGLMSLYYFTTEQSASAGIWLVGFFLFLALGFRGIPLLKGMSFTVLIFAAVVLLKDYLFRGPTQLKANLKSTKPLGLLFLALASRIPMLCRRKLPVYIKASMAGCDKNHDVYNNLLKI